MTTLAVIAFCIVLLVVAFLAPRLSRRLQRGGERPMQAGQRAARSAPGKLGELFSKPFSKGRKAISKSGSKGRQGRAKAPF